MGRLPAKWVYQLADIKLHDARELIDYGQLSTKFGISIRAAQAFCGKLELEADYRVENRHAVRQFLLKDLKKAAKQYIEDRS